ncbi:RNA chaperone Hfq [Psychromonas sp. SP041]|uniref:RNA chaperone Hfq n=1 Tax=Psychromonas sp. SP041 TaxID=1365007 RepID=UPI0010C7A549|nr:RNA chaperone Hfq [Psychromonas sp. SP041]
MTNTKTQVRFIELISAGKIPVSIFLQNGIKLQGVIDSFDDSCLILKNTTTQLIYKQSISTILPSK